jgi:catechol 2,3-dioxygenase
MLARGLDTMGIDRRGFLSAFAAALGAGLSPRVGGPALAQSAPKERVSAHRRPMFIERAGLRVRNLAGMITFYQEVIGLEIIRRDEREAVLSIDGVGLIELMGHPDAAQARPDAAGLYHIAFEMPTRTDLARWVIHAATNRFQVSGLADHRVTESVYLNDPEGNGVEVYADRPEAQWDWSRGEVAMGVFDLDMDDLLKLADRSRDDYAAAPAGMRLGHIHLRVGDLATAERFYSSLIGLDVTRRAPGVIFMSSGKYHHHLAVNIWESAGAPLRDEGTLGLAWFSIAVTDRSMLESQESRLREAGLPVRNVAGGLDVADPWGNEVRLTLV